MIRKLLALVLVLCLLAGSVVLASASEKTTIQFFFPVQLGGVAANLIEQFSAEFEELNPNIDVDPVFCGNYADTLVKLTLALEGGNAPQLVILDQRLLTLIAMDAVMNLDSYIADSGGNKLMEDFYAGYLASGQYNDSQYALPFQRSVLAMYYNRDHFVEAGLDPDSPPKTWAELLDIGSKLTKRNADGTVARWGVMISNSSAWAQQSMCITASETSENIYSEDGKKVFFNTPAVERALQFMLDLQQVGASPEGVIDEGMMPSSFIEGAVSMVAVSSGNLTNINNSVDFDFGVMLMPASASEYGASIGGGGDMYMVKGVNTTQAQYDATWEFMRYMSAPEQQARWSAGTGYIASRISAKENEVMKDHFAKVPQAEMMYQVLEHAYRQFTVFESAQIMELFINMFTSVALGENSIQDAMAHAQSEADYALEDYQ